MNKKIFGKQPSGERISGKTISGKGVRGSHIFHNKPSYKPIPVLAAAAFFAAAPFPADPVPAAFFPAASFLTVPFPAAPIPAYAAGWMQDGGRTAYELEDGSRPKDTWMELEGSWHYFDDQGFCRTGWYVDGQGKRFWLDGDGVLAVNTVRRIDGKFYAIDENGYCTEQKNYSGWVQEEGGWWFRRPDGSWPMAEWMEFNGEWYHFDDQGYVQSGWFEENGNRYWLDMYGKMLRDTEMVIDGIRYGFDRSGVSAREVKEPVEIPPEDQKTELERAVDAMADQVLAGIITPEMNDHQKATAIYYWVRRNMSYSAGTGNIGDWPAAAYEGFRRRRGHCYTYYSVSLALLSRAGIPSVEVIRETDFDHWWNLVYVDGEWLHFDTTPRRLGGDFCLLTTAQLFAYSDTHDASHVFDVSQYPATP